MHNETIKKIIAGLAGLIALTLSLLLLVPLISEYKGEERETSSAPGKRAHDEEKEQRLPSFTEETAREVMTDYQQTLNILIEDTDEHNYFTTFESENEIRVHLAEIMSIEHVTWLMDTYIEENDEGMYLFHVDALSRSEPVEAFTIEAERLDYYKIIPEQEVEMTYYVQWHEDKWIVNDVDSEQPAVGEVVKEVIDVLNRTDMNTLAGFVHEEQGLLFSPYVNVSDDDLVFQQEQIANFNEDNQVYYWGDYDGSGYPIELTPREYFDAFIHEEVLVDSDQLFVDASNQHGNVLNNLAEVFPEAAIVEAHYQGTEDEAYINWFSLHFVFEQNQHDSWKLVAIVSDQWTI